MTEQDQIKAIAELDGWTNVTMAYPESELVGTLNSERKLFTDLPPYLHSRDAIVPVIEKVLGEYSRIWFDFFCSLATVLNHPTFKTDKDYSQKLRLVLLATPSQLSEALLRSAGKWKD